MKWLWQKLGIVVFWLSWPVLYLYLRGSERARVLVTSGDQILVVQGWPGSGQWSLPGGGIHVGENRIKGALRELEEEVGLRLTTDQLQPLTQGMYHDKGFSFMCHYFIATLPQPVMVQAHFPEIIAADWINYRKADQINLAMDVRTALTAWPGQGLLQ